MTSKPPRPADRRTRVDLWRYRTGAGEDRARPGEPGGGERVGEAEVTLAIFGYLGAVFLGPVIPLGIYLVGRRMSPFTRHHAAMALNLSLTWLLYAVCCLILGGVLLLDDLTTALGVTLPIACVLWLGTVRYLIRGIGAAHRGEQAGAPAWICTRIAR
jgi:uncharacterized Tic20 family protein